MIDDPWSDTSGAQTSAQRPTSEPGEVRLVALGGLGEIGMNCLAIQQGQAVLVVDCGITFPEEDLGVDVYHPDFSFLERHRDSIAGVFLTHGHEDHVGALPYLLERLKVPVWGPPHALTVARHRLAEHEMTGDEYRLNIVEPGRRYQVGPFEVEPIRVAHSVVDATALSIRTSAGLIVHTGDFKFDPVATHPDDATDEARLSALGDEGVALLLSDSTNVDSSSQSRSESVVGQALASLIAEAKGRIVVGMFASNLQRLQRVGQACLEQGRKIAVFGRSLELSVRWGHELGRLDWPAELLVSRDRAALVDPQKLVVLAGGTQAEPTSALAQLASGSHPLLKLTPGDTVAFSSRIIPGNDRAVFRMLDALLRRGIVVRNWITDPDIHASGHAVRAELSKMLALTKPRAFIPVHGTLHHLTRHAELARTSGVENVVVIENGEVVALRGGGGLEKTGREPVGRVATWAGFEVSDEVISQRRALGRAGAVHITLILDSRGHMADAPSVWAQGVVGEDDQPSLVRAVALEVAKAVQSHAGSRGRNAGTDAMVEAARIAARRAVELRTGRRPVCAVTTLLAADG